ncbi:MAG: hypothetical protein HC894_05350 [Microcoleus sp. SM1_3_4]|nr:hypothetical protein [Microcoleus sp. SM1_3_4]
MSVVVVSCQVMTDDINSGRLPIRISLGVGGFMRFRACVTDSREPAPTGIISIELIRHYLTND